MEWAGAFGDVGTLIPFVVAYITIVKIPPLGLIFIFEYLSDYTNKDPLDN